MRMTLGLGGMGYGMVLGNQLGDDYRLWYVKKELLSSLPV